MSIQKINKISLSSESLWILEALLMWMGESLTCVLHLWPLGISHCVWGPARQHLLLWELPVFTLLLGDTSFPPWIAMPLRHPPPHRWQLSSLALWLLEPKLCSAVNSSQGNTPISFQTHVFSLDLASSKTFSGLDVWIKGQLPSSKCSNTLSERLPFPHPAALEKPSRCPRLIVELPVQSWPVVRTRILKENLDVFQMPSVCQSHCQNRKRLVEADLCGTMWSFTACVC